MEGSNNNKNFEYNEESESIDDSNEYNNTEGENILLRNKKKKIKKDLENYDQIQKELKKYTGKKISYNDLQNNSEEEEDEMEYEENEEESNDYKPNILNIENEENNEEKEISLQEKMEKQDEKYLKTLSKITKDEIRKSKNIINQKELYETFVGIRIALIYYQI